MKILLIMWFAGYNTGSATPLQYPQFATMKAREAAVAKLEKRTYAYGVCIEVD